MKTALISVSNKQGVGEFAQALIKLGFELLSTGGTAKLLREQGLDVIDVSDYTNFPEMMDGRVKTLHPKVHGGILGRRGVDDEVMNAHQMRQIDIVAVNLYPFEETISKPDCSLALAIKNIDIGGPSMVRGAAKNYRDVAVVVDPNDYPVVIEQLKAADNTLSEDFRFQLATKAFSHTANYDRAIAGYLRTRVQADLKTEGDPLPQSLNISLNKQSDLRYGENPHQQAAFYPDATPPTGTIGNAKQLQGKPLSYNNIADTDAAIDCVMAFDDPACCIVKHANPCGVALADNIGAAYEGAYRTDPTSAFGGIIAFNRDLDAGTADKIVSRQFAEVIVAPAVTSEAREVCARKKDLRVLEVGQPSQGLKQLDYKRVAGGFLLQDKDETRNTFLASDLVTVSEKQPTAEQLADLMFAWVVVKSVKSNAIVYARDCCTVGIGAGQMSRVYSARIAAIKAQDEDLEVANSVMASDAFFPFRDGIDAAAAVGISAVIQPGGSKRDEEVIAAANEHDMVMVFTGMRHFRH
ncbi:MAG: bifunctional phosphoribosylaminoimidazolecarboxamide formyltransferase/IMP cyclohydrolase [Pseudomonadota bacterium]